VDFIVSYGELVGLLHHVKTQFFLRDILGRQIDLATDDSLHPRMRDDILAEAIKAA